MEPAMTPKWQQRAWDIHQRFIRRAQAKGSLNSEAETVNFLALAICGEAGELANLIKKVWLGDEVDKQLIRDEIADVRIYLQHLAQHLGIEIDGACEHKLDVVAERIAVKERQADTSSNS
jgi:NTP pyrophosphatase (non-canonical NTP hydrolase)